MVGQVLDGRYMVEELVGSGGMASVYRAHDRTLDRKVALKLMHEHFTADREHVARFRHEARAVAALAHPNIVTVIDRGEHDGRPFIVFEYIEGGNLKRLIEKGGPLPVGTALELGIQVARGLDFAHRAGLVHRDVKPQNVLLNGHGQAKVTDFGIARSLVARNGLTQTGTVLGTSDYIAPEQAQGRQIGERTDVYSLGVVLYEALTGEVPYAGGNFVEVAMRHINEPAPSVRRRRSDVSPRLDAAIRRAMAKEPRDRFPAMADFLSELAACVAELEGSESTLRRPAVHAGRSRRGLPPWPIVSLLAGIVAIAAIAGYLVAHSGGGKPASSTLGAPVALTATAYDPYGTNGENDAAAHYATDGNPATSWETEQYYDAPSLGKPGVGLILDPGATVALHVVRVRTATPGFTAEIRAGDTRGPFPDTVSGPQIVGPDTTFLLGGRPHRYYLLWIMRLGPGFRSAKIAEITAR
jgi:eukaryotic-like serine/threonine-protein kinase